VEIFRELEVESVAVRPGSPIIHIGVYIYIPTNMLHLKKFTQEISVLTIVINTALNYQLKTE